MIYAIVAVDMYITDVPTLTREGKLSHLCTLLRESYRQNGKVKNRTLANLTHCNPKEVDAMRLTLKYKDDLTVLRSVEDIELEQGMSVGAAWAVYAELNQAGFHYITAITRPEIEKLLKTGVFQMGLFDRDICEVEDEGIRYILRRNPQRAEEIAQTRKEKRESIERWCQKKTAYLAGHPRAKVAKALDEVSERIRRLKISGWLKVEGGRR
jgi:hypothetical protein